MENILKPKQHDFKNRKGLAPLAVQNPLHFHSPSFEKAVSPALISSSGGGLGIR
jgi:hypothetical protein